MSEKTLRSMLLSLQLLTPADRAKIVARIRLLDARPDAGDEVSKIYDMVRMELGGKGLPPLVALRRTRKYARFRAGAEVLLAFASEVFGEMQREVRDHVLHLLVGCVVDHVKNTSHWGVGPVTIGDAMRSVLGIVESRFPGYLESGLLPYALIGKFEGQVAHRKRTLEKIARR